MEDKVDSDSQTEEIETRGLPVPEQHYAQRERCNPTYEGPTPIGEPHRNGRNRAKGACYQQHGADDHVNGDCAGHGIAQNLDSGNNAEDSRS